MAAAAAAPAAATRRIQVAMLLHFAADLPEFDPDDALWESISMAARKLDQPASRILTPDFQLADELLPFQSFTAVIDKLMMQHWGVVCEVAEARIRLATAFRTEFENLDSTLQSAIRMLLPYTRQSAVELCCYIFCAMGRNPTLNEQFKNCKTKSNEKYRVCGLLAIALLSDKHQVVFRHRLQCAPEDRVNGCSRIAKYHTVLGDMAKNYILAVFSALYPDPPAPRQFKLMPNNNVGFCSIREEAREKMRKYLLSNDCPEHDSLQQQLSLLESVQTVQPVDQPVTPADCSDAGSGGEGVCVCMRVCVRERERKRKREREREREREGGREGVRVCVCERCVCHFLSLLSLSLPCSLY